MVVLAKDDRDVVKCIDYQQNPPKSPPFHRRTGSSQCTCFSRRPEP
jgi:hypothetical protein